MSRTVAIIQARMGSTRLPGKVLADIRGKPMLTHVVERSARSAAVDEVVVATTSLPEDDVLAELANEKGWRAYRGSPDDVLDRYHGAALEAAAELVVRITSDCPLIDPGLITSVARLAASGRFDYVSNSLEPRTFPRGLDCEALTMEALTRAWREDRDPAWREHVTPYIYRHPDRFRLGRVDNPEDLSDIRWCVDTAEDLQLVRLIHDHLESADAGWREVLSVYARHPDWAAINADVAQKRLA